MGGREEALNLLLPQRKNRRTGTRNGGLTHYCLEILKVMRPLMGNTTAGD